MALVVFGMGQHGPDIYLSSIVVNRNDQPNLVASNIEHREFTNLVGGWEDGAKLGEICEGALFHVGVPTGQRRLGIRKFLGESLRRFRVTTCIKVILNVPASRGHLASDFHFRGKNLTVW